MLVIKGNETRAMRYAWESLGDDARAVFGMGDEVKNRLTATTYRHVEKWSTL